MKYLIYEKQDSQGCDYTISCGEKVTLVDANSVDEALALLYDNDDYEEEDRNLSCYLESRCEGGLERLDVFEIASVKRINVKALTDKLEKNRELEQKKLEEDEILRKAEEIKSRNTK